jgi:hypothetical protein
MSFSFVSDFPYENKRLAYFYRIENLIEELIAGCLYKDCLQLKGEKRERALKLKKYCPFTVDECRRQAKEITNNLQEKVDFYIKEFDLVDSEEAYSQMQRLLSEIGA